MKLLTAFLTLFFVTVVCQSQTKVDVKDALKHIGENVTICAKVLGVRELEKVNFINLGAAYPNSPVTVVVFAKDKTNFKNLTDYNGKDVCVTGTVKEYKGKAEIIIHKPDEISVQ